MSPVTLVQTRSRNGAAFLLICISEYTLFGHGPMSDLSPLSGEERRSDDGVVRSVEGPITEVGLRCIR